VDPLIALYPDGGSPEPFIARPDLLGTKLMGQR